MREYIVQAIEQETIDTFEANNAPELIRCKDCKFGSPISERELDFIFCNFRENKHQYATHGGCFEPEWFCADGEKR
jgi:hypothetical protein